VVFAGARREIFLIRVRFDLPHCLTASLSIVRHLSAGTRAAGCNGIVPGGAEDGDRRHRHLGATTRGSCGERGARVKTNIRLLYAFSFCDQFMIVIPLLVPYLAARGIGMAQFMELQAVFALVILAGEVPTGLLSDRWGRKKVLLLGAALKAASFSLLPLWNDYTGFLCYHLTMGIALSLISGGDVALLYESTLAAEGAAARTTAVLGNARLAAQTGAAASALVGGAVVTLSYGHLLWANAMLGWIPIVLVLAIAEPAASPDREQHPAPPLKEILAAVLTRDAATRLIFLNMVAWGVAGLLMVWINQKYWQDGGVPLAAFGALYAAYSLASGLGGKLAAPGAARFGRRTMLAAGAAVRVVATLGMAALLGSFLGWGGIALGLMAQLATGLGQVLFLNALNERIASAMRATVISMASLGVRASFSLLGPLAGYGIDAWGLAPVLSALGILTAIACVGLLLPLLRRDAVPGAARAADG
jgi:MFS family permease